MPLANVVITLRIMPIGVETNLAKIEKSVLEKIRNYTNNKTIKSEQEPIAFGLKALKIIFTADENKSLEMLENSIKENPDIASVLAIDVRRAIG